jgi:medium-chain acyl-[acyl-carrier-protein] hydrolase
VTPNSPVLRPERTIAGGNPANPWIMRFQPRPAPALRMFCFHHAGGGASGYRPWASALPAEVEICAVQLPGREGRLREQPYQRLSALVPVVSGVLEPLLDRPFVFFGHSLGALLAFEVARELARTGRPRPLHLYLSGRRAPTRPEPGPKLSHLPADALVAEVRRRWDGIPAMVLDEPELLQLLLPTLRADIALVETYAYVAGDALDCPISCFGGVDDPSLREADIAHWRDQTQAAFSHRMFPGGHFFVQSNREQVLTVVRDGLRTLLSRDAADTSRC